MGRRRRARRINRIRAAVKQRNIKPLRRSAMAVFFIALMQMSTGDTIRAHALYYILLRLYIIYLRCYIYCVYRYILITHVILEYTAHSPERRAPGAPRTRSPKPEPDARNAPRSPVTSAIYRALFSICLSPKPSHTHDGALHIRTAPPALLYINI